MKKKFVLLLMLFLFFNSCQEKKALPIKEDKLVDIIRDIHIAEAAMQNLIGITKDSMGEIYYQKTLDLHGVSRPDFDTSMAILRREPDRLGLIYDKVIEELTVIGDTLFNYQPKTR